jgi:hypothetical protein
MSDTAPDKRTDRSADEVTRAKFKRRMIGCVLIPGLIACCCLAGWIFFANSCIHPRDEVTVIVDPGREIAKGVFADSGGQLHAMRPYFGAESYTGSFSFSHGPRDSTERMGQVRWKFGSRYGVVLEVRENNPPVTKWSVVWFRAADVPLKGRSLFTGGGTVTFDLSKGQRESLSKEKAEQFGPTR